MTHLILDTTTSAELGKVTGPLDLCDANGKVLGRFIPIPLDKREPQVSEEELQRREAQAGGRPLNAILADLERRK